MRLPDSRMFIERKFQNMKGILKVIYSDFQDPFLSFAKSASYHIKKSLSAIRRTASARK